MTKTDNWLIERFQWLYDYAWDRWGIMVGMVGQIAMVADFGIDCMRGRAGVWSVIWIVVLVALLELRNRMQRNGLYTVLNKNAMEARPGGDFTCSMRRLFVILAYVVEILVGGFTGIITGSLFAVFFFSYCLMVRDRDEGRFKEHKLAYQENSNAQG